ncbi:hypothetical protein [Luteibacter yeojuensis]|uniref:Uncharacterized protein n=1 Tax=Luteibacter yeojuensis TaxID=345309 RepID=A0A7X5QVJ3_9GAMM|nr:hypothetical protein [Luteibacter yeojuensis]NID16207.1 hypothetical protein [Luteibacter yeojuensis]
MTLALPPTVFAQDIACTSPGAVKYETGLGAEIDDIVHIPSRFRSETREAQRNEWTFEYGNAAYANRATKQITIRQGASALNMASQLSHEVGHANYNYREDLSSRDAYIRKACVDEGFGLLENIIAHRALKKCSGMDMGLITAEPDFFLAKYEELAQRPPVYANEIGYMFCERNRVPTGETYIDYYGNWYDANYGLAVESSGVEVDAELWDRVEDMAERARLGASKLREVWPAEAGSGVRSLSKQITVAHSEIRQRSDGSVGLAYMNVAGRCISRSEVLQRYPELYLTQAPRPHDPPGTTRTVWSALGEWGEVMFAFTGKTPNCLEAISFNPWPQPLVD